MQAHQRKYSTLYPQRRCYNVYDRYSEGYELTYLEIIRRAIEEHHKVRAGIRLVGEAINDFEALFSLEKTSASWSQSSVEELAGRVEQLRETVAGLQDGLGKHFGFEEQYLPPVFGESLMKALVFEHNEIRHKLAETAAALGSDLKAMPQAQLLAQKYLVEQVIDGLCQSVEAHAGREETIFRMLERALEAEQKQPGG